MFGHKARKYAGEVEYVGLDGKSVVRGIKQCCHCGSHWVPQPGSGNRRGFCMNCSGDLCSDKCAERCEPFEKKINEAREHALRREREG